MHSTPPLFASTAHDIAFQNASPPKLIDGVGCFRNCFRFWPCSMNAYVYAQAYHCQPLLGFRQVQKQTSTALWHVAWPLKKAQEHVHGGKLLESPSLEWRGFPLAKLTKTGTTIRPSSLRLAKRSIEEHRSFDRQSAAWWKLWPEGESSQFSRVKTCPRVILSRTGHQETVHVCFTYILLGEFEYISTDCTTQPALILRNLDDVLVYCIWTPQVMFSWSPA